MIKFDNVGKTYPNGTEALKNVNLEINQGEFIAIIGLSGAGKSTLIRLINKMHDVTEGTLIVNGTVVDESLKGKDLRKFRRGIGMVFQSFNLIGRTSVLKNVLAARVADISFFKSMLGWYSKHDKIIALNALEKLGILEKAYGRADQLSGGQMQRVAIARALVNDPNILLADEPTGALDPVTGRAVLDIFKELNETEGVSFLIVTHSKEVAAFANRSLELRDGRFVAEHGAEIDVEDLTEGRELLIDDLGTVTLPPDLLVRIGGSGRYSVALAESGMLTLQGESYSTIGQLVLASTCPACKHDYGESDEQQCPSCGSSRPMVEASS